MPKPKFAGLGVERFLGDGITHKKERSALGGPERSELPDDGDRM